MNERLKELKARVYDLSAVSQAAMAEIQKINQEIDKISKEIQDNAKQECNKDS